MGRKKTHEEYVAEVAIVNPNIEVVGTYINNRTNILHRCKIDGYEWMPKPANILFGNGCPKCAKLIVSQKRTKTHEDYMEQVAIINPNIEVVEAYINATTKILHRCKIDGHEWSVRPDDVLHGTGCPECARRKLANRFAKTHDEYVAQVNIINPNIEVVGKYVNNRINILHRCKIDGYEWYAKPANILNGCGCPKCRGSMKKTHEEYVSQVATINPNVEVVEMYVNDGTKILHRCKVDGYEWMVRPGSVLKGHGCPRCANVERYTNEEYVKRVSEINADIEVIGTYIGSHMPILHRCKIDGYEWCIAPANVLYGQGCPKCNTSKGEKIVACWLQDMDILYEPQKKFDDCQNKRSLPFDFYLPKYNIAIEYQGIQHYEPVDYFGGKESFESVVRRDKIKKEYCEKNNISLITIPYFLDIYEELDKLYELIMAKEVA